MTNVALDCSGTIAVPGGTSQRGAYNARLKLPPGDALTRDLVIGVPTNANSTALLQLRSTRMTVTNLATVGLRGTISNVVDGASGGLDLAGAASLVVSNGGKITLVFQPPRDPEIRVYWGLRWAGNHASALQALQSAGQLGWNDSALASNGVAIFVYRGYTYIGRVFAPHGSLLRVR